MKTKEIKEPPKTLIINVTQKDIDKGCMGKSTNCPIARAANRLVHKLPSKDFEASVASSLHYINYESGDVIAYISQSDQILQFVSDFDNKKPVSPIKIKVQLSAVWNKTQ